MVKKDESAPSEAHAPSCGEEKMGKARKGKLGDGRERQCVGECERVRERPGMGETGGKEG